MLVVAVTLLIAVAGCSGLSGGATPTASETTNGTENATTTPAASTDTPGELGTVTEERAPAPTEPETETNSAPDLEANGTGAGLDGEELNNATRAAVEDAGSYTLDSLFAIVSQTRRGQTVSRQVGTTQVDLEAEQGLRVSDQSFEAPRDSQTISTTVYTEGNTSYRQRITSEGTNYTTQEGAPTNVSGVTPVNTSTFVQNLTYVTDGLVWETNGTTTVDGDNVTEYTLAGLEDQEAYTERIRGTLTDIGGTLYVDDDDVVRQASLVYETESRVGTSTLQSQFTVRDIGSTTVEEPEWTSEADDADSS